MNIRQMLDKFILHFPVLFIKQYPYAWIVVIVLWSWPPNFSALFLSVILVGILSLRWREAAWISEMRRQHAPKNETFYIDRVPIPWARAARNLAILAAVGVAAAWFLGPRLFLGFWKAFTLVCGFGLFYFDVRFFGAATIYIVTGGGIAVYFVPGHTDYRIFLRFNEMDRIVQMDRIEKRPESWSVLSRVRDARSGVLLTPRHARGFTRLLDGEVLLTPTNMDEFLKLVPSTLVMNQS